MTLQISNLTDHCLKKKVIGLMKDEQITKEFVGLRAKTCSYVIDDGSKDKKGKATKKYVNKKIIKTL